MLLQFSARMLTCAAAFLFLYYIICRFIQTYPIDFNDEVNIRNKIYTQ